MTEHRINAETFNEFYSVGTPVFAYPGFRPEDVPSAPRLVTRTRSRATVLGGHTDVVWVDGHGACIALTHVDVVSEDEFETARAEAMSVAAVEERVRAQIVDDLHAFGRDTLTTGEAVQIVRDGLCIHRGGSTPCDDGEAAS